MVPPRAFAVPAKASDKMASESEALLGLEAERILQAPFQQGVIRDILVAVQVGPAHMKGNGLHCSICFVHRNHRTFAG